jgi:hypothetical protein
MIGIGGRSMETSRNGKAGRAATFALAGALAVASLVAGCGSRSVIGDPSCNGNLTDCGGQCVSLADDPEHCGACGVVCNATSTCGGGNCNPCPAGQSACGNQCFDLQTDPNHCGTCPTLCQAGHACVGGVCQ